jgi:hypothetical protein
LNHWTAIFDVEITPFLIDVADASGSLPPVDMDGEHQPKEEMFSWKGIALVTLAGHLWTVDFYESSLGASSRSCCTVTSEPYYFCRATTSQEPCAARQRANYRFPALKMLVTPHHTNV